MGPVPTNRLASRPALRQDGAMPSSPAALRRLARARDLIGDAYAEPLTLERIARESGLSRFHLLRAFRETFGETPAEHLRRVRIARAKELLGRGAGVTEACFGVGFSSVGSFSALFSRSVGRSPEAWRRTVRGFGHVPVVLLSPHVPTCFAMFYGAPV